MRKLFTILIAFHLMLIPVPKAHAGIVPGMEQITGIAIAAVGVGVAMKCTIKYPSLLLYMAGAAVYLMGEMKGGKAQKKSIEDEDAKVKEMAEGNNMGGEVQLATLEAQLKDKQEKKKIADGRAKWSGAAAAMMIAAAALAAAENLIPPLFGTTVCAGGPHLIKDKMIGMAVIAGYSFLSGGGIMGALEGALMGMVVAQNAIISVFSSAMGRAAAMAVAGGLAMMASSSAAKEASKLQKEIEDLEKLIAQFHKETDRKGPNDPDTTAGAEGGTTTGEVADTGGVSSGTTSGTTAGTTGGGVPVNPLPPGTEVGGTTTCLTSNQQFSNDCSNPMTFTSPNLSMFGDQPELQQVANKGIQMANDAARGNTGKADIAAADLNGSGARMADALKKNVAKANAKLKAQGKKVADFEKQKQDILNSMQSSFDKQIAGNQPALAFVNGSKIGLEDPSKASGQQINGASTTAAIAVPTSDGKAQDAVDPSLNGSTAATTADQKPTESAASSLGKNLDEYESNENDISKNSGESLWRQVSNRYLLNYDRFFEKKKLPAQ